MTFGWLLVFVQEMRLAQRFSAAFGRRRNRLGSCRRNRFAHEIVHDRIQRLGSGSFNTVGFHDMPTSSAALLAHLPLICC